MHSECFRQDTSGAHWALPLSQIPIRRRWTCFQRRKSVRCEQNVNAKECLRVQKRIDLRVVWVDRRGTKWRLLRRNVCVTGTLMKVRKPVIIGKRVVT